MAADTAAAFQQAVQSDCPKNHADQFSYQMGYGDIAIAFHHIGRPIGIVTIPYGLAKSLAAQISASIQNIESATHQVFRTPEETDAMITEYIKGQETQKGVEKK